MMAAQGASFADESWMAAQSGAGDRKTKSFAGEEAAREYLTGMGIIDEAMEEHFLELGAIADYGQLLSVLGNLYTALMRE